MKLWLAVLLMAVLAGGCQTVSQTGTSGTATDASGARLQAICEHLLWYYMKHRTLPPNLEALRGAGPGELPPLVSPNSGELYVYHSALPSLPRRPGRLLIHDPSPATALIGEEPARWVVLVEYSATRGQLLPQVIPVSADELEAALTRGVR